MTVLSVYTDKELKAKLSDMAKEQRRSLSNLIDGILREATDNWRKKKKP